MNYSPGDYIFYTIILMVVTAVIWKAGEWFILRYFMSPRAPDLSSIEAVADDVANEQAESLPRIAKPGNAGNTPLPFAHATTDDTIDYAKLEALADLILAEKVGMADGIETVFKCKRSGRPTSRYQQVHAVLQPLVKKEAPPRIVKVHANNQTYTLNLDEEAA